MPLAIGSEAITIPVNAERIKPATVVFCLHAVQLQITVAIIKVHPTFVVPAKGP